MKTTTYGSAAWRRILVDTPLLAAIALIGASVMGTGLAVAAESGNFLERGDSAGKIHIVPVQGNVYMVVGNGANIAVQVGADGILLVDAGITSMSDELVDAMEVRFQKPIRFLVETTIFDDHIGGAANVARRGRRYDILSGNPTNPFANQGEGASVIAAQALFNRLALPKSRDYTANNEEWPNDAYEGPRKLLSFNGEAVHILHQPNANTDGDSIVWFTGSNVISAGEIFSTVSYPRIDLDRGGSVQGVVDGLNRLMYQLTAAGPHQENGTLVIPGHGRISDQADLGFYQQMVVIIRDRIEEMVAKGMTLQQVIAAQPTLDYDARYGSTTGEWTTNKFIEAVYTSLRQARQGRRTNRG